VNFLDRFSKNTRNIKFHENPSSGSRVVACGRTDRQTDMTKLIVAYRNFANAPKNRSILFTRTVDVLHWSPTINPCKQSNRLVFVMDIYHVYCAVRTDCLCTGVKDDSDNRPNHPSGLSPRRPGFDPRSFLLSCVMGRMTLGQVFVQLFRFYPIIPPLLHIIFLLSEGQAGETWVSGEVGSFQVLRCTGLAFILG